jgi:protein involved in polysaccharide export with SLBB domain
MMRPLWCLIALLLASPWPMACGAAPSDATEPPKAVEAVPEPVAAQPPEPVLPPAANDPTGTPQPPEALPAPAAPTANAEKTAGKVVGNRPPVDPNSWRYRYELGPGDSVNISLFGRPELDRSGIRVGPDGKLSFLQAQDIPVGGMSIDEARVALEKALASHFKSPRIILTPLQVASKRYTIMGKVVIRGVVTLDRPVTLVEAVANAGGMETGLYEHNTIELADYDRSFISRQGKRLPIDFRKLLLQGEMALNVDVEPGDFIYIASNMDSNYYVLGAVANPGMQGFTEDASVVAGISRRGGFSERAWTDRILVIRGSLDAPQTFAISLKDILAAKAHDFKIEPKDIVYVAERPWIFAEDVLDAAFSAFVTSASSSWVNRNVDPIINPP